MSGKRLAFVVTLVYMSWTNAVYAVDGVAISESADNIEISVTMPRARQDYRDFLMSYLFGAIPNARLADAPESKTEQEGPEQRILARWKDKQTDRWKELPTEKFEIVASAYTASSDECGKADGKTASGLMVTANRTLACPANYPFGAKIAIDGYGTFRCEDRGGAIRGNRFDIYMLTKKEAFAFGRRRLLAEVVAD
ncbi:MAG: hypothetical protein HGA31_01180 [Candidatus Moranbacteria bacterium]|nr:hypothetical protein [Candidatus Moranbacteria bacterium]